MIVDGYVDVHEAARELGSKWADQTDPSILRTNVCGRKAVDVYGPYSRTIHEASLRAHSLTRDNGPIISRLLSAD